MKQKVLILSTTPFYGGGEQFIVRLISGLHQRIDFAVIGCSQKLHEALKPYLHPSYNIFIKKKPAINRILSVASLLRNRTDLHSYQLLLNGQGNIYVLPFIKNNFQKIFYVQHTLVHMNTSSLKKKLLLYWLKKNYITIVCVSKTIYNELCHLIQPKNISVIYNWVAPPLELPAYHAEAFPLKLIYLGAIEKNKSIITLLEAVKEIKNLELTILGTGSLHHLLEQQYSAYNFIHFAGWQNHTEPYLYSSHLNIVCSLYESFSYTVVEAGVAGIPSLISNIPVHKEISQNGTYAFLFEARSVTDLKNKIIMLQQNRTLLEEMHQKCLSYYKDNFSPHQSLEQYYSLFNQ